MPENFLPDTCALIAEWTPDAKCTSEPEYRSDLVAHLRAKLKHPLAAAGGGIRSYDAGGSRFAHIALGGTIGIELSPDLTAPSQVNRVVEKMHRYREEFDDLIIVLVGNPKLEQINDLNQRIRRMIPTKDNPKEISLGRQLDVTVLDRSVSATLTDPTKTTGTNRKP